jgi:chaperonin GroES
MNFKPLGDRVLVKVKEPETTTASGIILPDNASKEKPTQAEVLAIGDFVKNIEIGNTVVYGRYAGTELSLDGDDYLVLEGKDILGVIS